MVINILQSLAVSNWPTEIPSVEQTDGQPWLDNGLVRVGPRLPLHGTSIGSQGYSILGPIEAPTGDGCALVSAVSGSRLGWTVRPPVVQPFAAAATSADYLAADGTWKTIAEVDLTSRVQKSGDTMTGNLSMSGSARVSVSPTGSIRIQSISGTDHVLESVDSGLLRVQGANSIQLGYASPSNHGSLFIEDMALSPSVSGWDLGLQSNPWRDARLSGSVIAASGAFSGSVSTPELAFGSLAKLSSPADAQVRILPASGGDSVFQSLIFGPGTTTTNGVRIQRSVGATRVNFRNGNDTGFADIGALNGTFTGTVDAAGYTVNGVPISSGTIGGSTGAADNRVLRSDGTGGAVLQASSVTIDDSGSLIAPSGNIGGITFRSSTGEPYIESYGVPLRIVGYTNAIVKVCSNVGLAVRNQADDADGPFTASEARLTYSGASFAADIITPNVGGRGIRIRPENLSQSAVMDWTEIRTGSNYQIGTQTGNLSLFANNSVKVVLNASTGVEVRDDTGLKVRNTAANADSALTAGAITSSSGISGVNYLASASGYFAFSGRAGIDSPADGRLKLDNAAHTAGVGFDVTTDGTLQLRNRAFNADAAITAGAATFSGTVRTNMLQGASTVLTSITMNSPDGHGITLTGHRGIDHIGGQTGHRWYSPGSILLMSLNTNGLLQFGGINSSFPAIKRNGTAINFRLADDSADANITAGTATFSTSALTLGASGAYSQILCSGTAGWGLHVGHTGADVLLGGSTPSGATLRVGSAVSTSTRLLINSNQANNVQLQVDTTSAGDGLNGSNAQSLVNLVTRWNTTGTPTLIKADVTDTASNAASLLMDLQVSGVSQFKVTKSGTVDSGVGGRYLMQNNIITYAFNGATDTGFRVGSLSAGSRSIMCYTDNGLALTLGGSGASRAATFTGQVVAPSLAIVNGGTHSLYGNGGNGFTVEASAQLYLRAYQTHVGMEAGSFAPQTSSVAVDLGQTVNNTAWRNIYQRGEYVNYNASMSGTTNYERGYQRWTSNVYQIGTESAGTGVVRDVSIKRGTGTSVNITGGRVDILDGAGGHSSLAANAFYFSWWDTFLQLGSNVAGSRSIILNTDNGAALTLGGSGVGRAATFGGNVQVGTGAANNTLNIVGNNAAFTNVLTAEGSAGLSYQMQGGVKSLLMRTSGIELASGSRINWTSNANAGQATEDAAIVRSSTAVIDVRADSGLRVRNLADSGWALLQTGPVITSGNIRSNAVGAHDLGSTTNLWQHINHRGDYLNYNAGFNGTTTYERGFMRWTSNEFCIGNETIGGSLRYNKYVGNAHIFMIGGAPAWYMENSSLNPANTVTDFGSQAFPLRHITLSGTISHGQNARWTIPGSGQRNSEVGNDAGVWQTGYREAYNAAGVRCGLYGVTPAAQPVAAATTTGHTAGAGTALKLDDTHTGGVGASAYTLGDIVRALKEIGAIAM